jgi:hypothetical protein
VGESRRLARSAAGDEEINAALDLPGYQVAQGSVVNGAILMKWSDQRCTTAAKIHLIKIARIAFDGNGWRRGLLACGFDQFDELRFNPDGVHARQLTSNLANFKFQEMFVETDDREDPSHARLKKRPSVHLALRQNRRNSDDPNFVAYVHPKFRYNSRHTSLKS